jgi:UDP-N-acetyl-2-amino-2-deoxyglucuronate dehydrogenase
LISVRVRWCRTQRYYDLAPWRGTFALDGGALTNQGVHHIDLLRHLGGEVESVNASMRTFGADIEVEDTVVATVQFRSGAIGTVEVTTAARPDDYEASISFVCEKGLAQVGGIAMNELQVYSPAPAECRAHSEDFSRCVYGFGHEFLYQEIRDALLEGKPYSIQREDADNTLQLLHAFYCSEETGKSVKPGSEESVRLGRADEKLAKLYRTILVEAPVFAGTMANVALELTALS